MAAGIGLARRAGMARNASHRWLSLWHMHRRSWCRGPPLNGSPGRGGMSPGVLKRRCNRERRDPMYTKPSVDDLIEGVTRTLEQGLLPLLKDRPDAAQAIPPVVATLQRVTQEWAAAVSNLVASNDDIERTL